MQQKEINIRRIKMFTFFALVLAYSVPNYSQYQLTPLAVRIMTEFSLTQQQFTSVFSAPMVPAIFTSIICGLLVDRYGSKPVVGVAVVLSVCGFVIRYFATGYWALYIGMLLLGFSCGFICSNASKIVGRAFGADRVGVVWGYGISISTFVMIISTATSAYFTSIKAAFAVSLVLGAIDIVVWFACMPSERTMRKLETGDKPAEPVQAPSISKCLKVVLSNKGVWMAGIGLFCACGAMIASASLISAALMTRGMSEASAGTVSAMSLVGNMLGSLICPTIAAKTGKFRLIQAISCIVCLVGTAFSWLAPFGIPLYIALIITGMSIGSILPQLMAVVFRLPGIGATYAGTAGGVTATLQLLGGVFIPTYFASAIAGDNYYLYFILAGAFMVVGFVAVLMLPKELDGKAS